jgi:eukaryotic-like serine/threonine-protein kinase
LLDQALQSLAEAHGKGLLHRDIKPSNLFLTEQAGQFDWLKVLDFGLVKKMQEAPGQSMISVDGAVIGSPLYMAPERFYGEHEVDHRSDLYALGAVAYFLLTGKPVFDVKNPMQALVEHARTAPASLRSRGVDLSAELDALVLRCLDKEPGRRFAGAEELRAALQKTPEWGSWTQEKARRWWEKNVQASASRGVAVAEATPEDARPTVTLTMAHER